MSKMRKILAGSAFIAGLASSALAQDQFEAMKETCIACHGEAASDEVPHLGGLDSYYALLQLVAFRGGQRENEIMSGIVEEFSDNDLRVASEWVATLPPPAAPASQAPDASQMEAGAALSSQHRCNSCHGADYKGGRQMPSLRNQREAYVAKSLLDYKAERRIGDRAAMVEIATALSDEDIEKLAYYMAHLEEQ